MKGDKEGVRYRSRIQVGAWKQGRAKRRCSLKEKDTGGQRTVPRGRGGGMHVEVLQLYYANSKDA